MEPFRLTLDAVIGRAVLDWRADHTALGPDPMGGAHDRVARALYTRVPAHVQEWLRGRRDEELEELEADRTRREGDVNFYALRMDESATGTMAELKEAYLIIGIMAEKLGGSVQITTQDRLVGSTLTVEISELTEDGTLTIAAETGNSPVGTVVGSDSEDAA